MLSLKEKKKMCSPGGSVHQLEEAVKLARCHCTVAEAMKNPPLIPFDAKQDRREKNRDHLDVRFPLPVTAEWQ